MANDSEWHIKKEISVGHMITTILLAGALVGVYSDMSSAILANSEEIKHVRELHEKDASYHEKAMSEGQRRSKESLEKLDRQLEKMDRKLDKLIDRELDNGN